MEKTILSALLTVLAWLAATPAAMAAPARPGAIRYVQPDGTDIVMQKMGDEWCDWYADLEGRLLLPDAEGCYRVATAQQEAEWRAACEPRWAQRQQVQELRSRQLRARRSADSHMAVLPVDTTLRVVVLLVEFPDVRFSMADPQQHYTDQMMQPGCDWGFTPTTSFRHKGSVHDYFDQCSDGRFDLQFEVYGPVMMPDSVRHYADDKNLRAWQMVVNGCEQINDSVDFRRFDQDQDGCIDVVAVVYAGPGSNATTVSRQDAVWPHQWSVSYAGGPMMFVDDVQIDTYVCVNEMFGGRPDGMGTFCHEFSHALGLNDHYGEKNANCCTPDAYDVMDQGAYNLNGYRPAAYSAYERYEMGWLEPRRLNHQPAATLTLPPLTLQPEAFIYVVGDTHDDPRDGEYYIFENRQPYLWDEYLPGQDMLVWHIDYNASRWNQRLPNKWPDHQCVDLVEADGQYRSGGRFVQNASAPFPGSADHTSFTDDTEPAFRGWTYPNSNEPAMTVPLHAPITNIHQASLAALPPDVLSGKQLYNIVFDYLSPSQGDAALTPTHLDTHTPPHLQWLNGRVILCDGHGHSYDVMGREISN